MVLDSSMPRFPFTSLVLIQLVFILLLATQIQPETLAREGPYRRCYLLVNTRHHISGSHCVEGCVILRTSRSVFQHGICKHKPNRRQLNLNVVPV